MWDILKKNDEECGRLRDRLEEAAAKLEDAIQFETLVAKLPEEQRKHVEACADCREAVNGLVKVRELFQGAGRFSEEDKPWFAARVMAAIAAREREVALRMTTWAEFPRLASRLAWIAGVLLLAGTTWLYERATPSNPPNGSGGQESIFEATPQSNPDDILISMAESNP